LRGSDYPFGSDGCAGGDALPDSIRGSFTVDDQLKVSQTRTVVDGNELVVAKGADPTLYQNFTAYLRFIAQIHNAFSLHNPRKLIA
jgi:hypothetical protein